MKKIDTQYISEKKADLEEIKYIVDNIFTEDSEEWLCLYDTSEKNPNYVQIHSDIEYFEAARCRLATGAGTKKAGQGHGARGHRQRGRAGRGAFCRRTIQTDRMSARAAPDPVKSGFVPAL